MCCQPYLLCCVHKCISLQPQQRRTRWRVPCIQSRVETAEVKIKLSAVAAGSAAVNDKVVAASEGGRR